METTTSDKKQPPVWLKIDLGYRRQDDLVTFIINFCNTHQIKQELAFSNRAHKAELLGLLIEDAANQRVVPRHNMLIKPVQPDPDKHLLAAGASLSYKLSGKLVGDLLEFPGARFELKRGETYQVCFRYSGILSDKISFTV